MKHEKSRPVFRGGLNRLRAQFLGQLNPLLNPFAFWSGMGILRISLKSTDKKQKSRKS